MPNIVQVTLPPGTGKEICKGMIINGLAWDVERPLALQWRVLFTASLIIQIIESLFKKQNWRLEKRLLTIGKLFQEHHGGVVSYREMEREFAKQMHACPGPEY